MSMLLVILVVLFGVIVSFCYAHRAPSDLSDAPEVSGVETDVDNTWLLDQSFLIFCMLLYFLKLSIILIFQYLYK